MYVDLITDLQVTKGGNLLDVGCGNGNIVHALRQRGIAAFGCDVEFKDGPFISDLVAEGIVKKIGSNTTARKDISKSSHDYSWPWQDKQFDFVCSRAVIEHVNNIDQFLIENHRVLKPGGVSLHYFPSKYSIVEPHIGILLGGVFQNLNYYKIMSNLGLCRNRYKKNGELAYQYMKRSCFYNTDADIKQKCEDAGFHFIEFNSKLILKHYKRGKYKYLQHVPLFCWIFLKMRSRIIMIERQL